MVVSAIVAGGDGDWRNCGRLLLVEQWRVDAKSA